MDDVVFIDGQNLWTSNFTVPNYYLTGDHAPEHRFHNRSVVYPKTDINKNDYFDKAFIY